MLATSVTTMRRSCSNFVIFAGKTSRSTSINMHLKLHRFSHVESLVKERNNCLLFSTATRFPFRRVSTGGVSLHFGSGRSSSHRRTMSTRLLVLLHRKNAKTSATTRTLRSSTSSTAVVAAASPQTSSRWHRIARVIRYVRIPVIVISVYALGYQQGVIDCTKEPVALQNQIINSILVSIGCSSTDDVHIVSEKDISWHSSARHHQVAAVGHKIVSRAREYVEDRLEEAMQSIKNKLPPDIAPERQLAAMEGDADVQFWYHARLRLEGEAVQKQPWQYIFIESAAPNAFVTEVLPRRFFITTGMLKVAETPDELAVVLGHEVSHLILGHVSDTNKIETALRTVEVLLLSMDPTAGLLSVFVIGLIYAARRVVSAAYSRDNERQADELGLQLAASACYDTAAGSHVMYKMHQAATGMATVSPPSSSSAAAAEPKHRSAAGGAGVVVVKDNNETSTAAAASSVVRLMDTHPPSLDRWERMQQAAAAGENYRKYERCAGISSRFFNALWGSSSTTVTKGKEKKV